MTISIVRTKRIRNKPKYKIQLKSNSFLVSIDAVRYKGIITATDATMAPP
jgi:hypothetical protein